MSRALVPPQFPLPPEEYDRQYFDEMVRSLTQLVVQLQNPGEMRGTKLSLTALPVYDPSAVSADNGLEPGSLYRIGNDVKISLLDRAVPQSADLSTSVGTVTVSTP